LLQYIYDLLHVLIFQKKKEAMPVKPQTASIAKAFNQDEVCLYYDFSVTVIVAKPNSHNKQNKITL
jgi:hypothetical protein